MSLVDQSLPGQKHQRWLRHPFLLLWTASTSSYFASWALKLALPLIAARMTSSPLLVSGVTFSLMLPWLLFGLLAGTVTDRFDRRHILLSATVLRLGTLGLLILAAALQAISLLLLYGAALVLGITETLTETATTALIPHIVPHRLLERANALLLGMQQLLEVIALPVGGMLAAAGLALAAELGGTGYVVALLTLLLLRGSFRPAHPAKRHLVADIVDGVRCLWQHTTLRTIAIMAAVINACWSAWSAVLVLYAVAPGPMRLTSFQYGVMLTGSGVGGIIGALLTGRVQRWMGRRWLIGLNILGNGLMFAVSSLTANAWLMGLAILLGGIGSPLWGVAATSLQQRSVPAALQGRVFAAYRFISWGAEAIGPVIGGSIAQYFGIQTVFLGSALLTALLLLPFFQVVTEQALSLAHPHKQ